MEPRARMSPLTALFLGMFGVGAVAIIGGASALLYGMRIVDQKSSALIGFAGDTLEGLPELLASLPPAISDALSDRRLPAYAAKIDVTVQFLADADGLRPVLTVTNKGDEVVSLLALRVAALNARQVALHDWTEVAATPIAIDEDWPGPLMPGAQRHLVLHRCRSITGQPVESIESAVEITDVRVWTPKAEM